MNAPPDTLEAARNAVVEVMLQRHLAAELARLTNAEHRRLRRAVEADVRRAGFVVVDGGRHD